MHEKRVFTEEELKNMGRRHVDGITEAIDTGDLDRAKNLSERMYRECLAMHDGLIAWITALLSFVGRRYGDEAIYEALRESCRSWVEPLGEIFTHAGVRQRVVMLAKVLRGHLMPMKIEEDDEKFTFIMEPCGSGGRLVLSGRYQPPQGFLKIARPQPITCGQKDFPVYCAHAAMVAILGIETTGAPIFYEEPSDNIGEKPCKIYLYKDPKGVPAELYSKVGKKKSS